MNGSARARSGTFAMAIATSRFAGATSASKLDSKAFSHEIGSVCGEVSTGAQEKRLKNQSAALLTESYSKEEVNWRQRSAKIDSLRTKKRKRKKKANTGLPRRLGCKRDFVD